MATLDELTVHIKAETAGLSRGLQQAVGSTQQAAGKMQSAFGGLNTTLQSVAAGFATYFSARYFKGIVDATDRLNDLSNQTGVSVEALSELSYVAKLSGTSIESLAQGLKLMGRNISDAAAGTGTAKDALKDFGINAKEVGALPLDQQLEIVAEALSKVKSSGDQVSYVMDIMGRSGAELLPAMQDGAKGIRELREEARAMGVTITGETAASFAQLNDDLDRLAMGSTAFARTLLENVVPAINDLVAGLNELLAQAPSTSKFFNSLGAAWVGLRGMTGLDPDIVDAALLTAGENTARGETSRSKPGRKLRNTSGGTRRTDHSAEKQQEAKDYDAASDALGEYLRNLGTENDLLKLNAREREVAKAVMEAQNAAMRDGITGLRDSALLYPEEIEQVKRLAEAHHELTEAARKMEEQQRQAQETAREWQNKMTDGLTDVILHFDSAGDAAKRFFDEIASNILKQHVTGPLSQSISGAISGSGGGFFSGIGKMLGFADGGSPPVGVPSIVGERGPEIFVPKTAGMVVPNHALGGSSVTVQNVWNIGDGVTQRQLAALIPQIEARTTAAVAASIENGGRMSRLVNRKS